MGQSNRGGGVIANFSWKFAERITAQIVSLLVSIMLARILEPEHYGIVSIVMIFISIANVFVSDGLGQALIQKKDADALDYSSVLYANIIFSIALYLILYIAAPYIARFYGDEYEQLAPVLRVLGLRLILTGINSVQQAYVAKRMIFKKFFWATLFGTVVSAIVGIIMAYAGFGVWALVVQYLTNTTVDTIVLFVILKKKPLLKFSYKRVKGLLGYGFRLLLAGLLIQGFNEIRALVIGKFYTSADLAYFDKGKQFPHVIGQNINTSVGAVLFPKMAEEQENISNLKCTTQRSIRMCSYIMSPLMFGFAAISSTFVSVVLTDKWLPCVPLMQLFCIVYLFQPIHTANLQAIKALGRSDIFLRLEIVKKILEVIALIMTIKIDINAVVFGIAIITTLSTFINAFPNKKLLNYSFTDQLKDISPSLAMSLIMIMCVLLVGNISGNKMIVMIIQIGVGALVYISLSAITRNKEFMYIINLIRSLEKH